MKKFDRHSKLPAETGIHQEQLNYLVESLKTHFQLRTDVCVSGNAIFYYQEEMPRKFFSPDVMVCFDVSGGGRRSFKCWEEEIFPQVIFEISSRKTWSDDITRKWLLYQQLGAKEYYIFDVEYNCLPEPLIAYRFKRKEFKLTPVRNNRIFSEEIGLEIVDTGEGLRLFNPLTNKFM